MVSLKGSSLLEEEGERVGRLRLGPSANREVEAYVRLLGFGLGRDWPATGVGFDGRAFTSWRREAGAVVLPTRGICSRAWGIRDWPASILVAVSQGTR
jgi:hypothetical protein